MRGGRGSSRGGRGGSSRGGARGGSRGGSRGRGLLIELLLFNSVSSAHTWSYSLCSYHNVIHFCC